MKIDQLIYKGNKLSPKVQLNQIRNTILDPLGKKLTNYVNWIYLDGISETKSDLYPVTIIGEGPPVLLLHGFDSCFLEFRRLVPFLKNDYKLIIPDMFGFGFCPRPIGSEYGLNKILIHLDSLINQLSIDSEYGVIGASMGGGIALEFARKNTSKVNRLQLLSPAGLTGNPKPIYRPFDTLGVCILKQSFIRKKLCRQAFSDPDKNVGVQEEQIASIHLQVPGWGYSLSAFARSGGVASCAKPSLNKPISVIWGEQDKILTKDLREESIKSLNCKHEKVNNCGHLPHLESPEYVAKCWIESK